MAAAAGGAYHWAYSCNDCAVSASMRAAEKALLHAVALIVGSAQTLRAESCSCEWNMEDDGMFYSSGDPVSVEATSAEECKKACCYNSHQKVDFECHAFAHEVGGLGCLLYQEVPKALNWGAGHTSGSLKEPHTRCSEADEGDGEELLASFEHSGWGIVAVFAVLFGGYTVVGTALSGGQLPHREFWQQAFGLVQDGLMFTVRMARQPERGTSVQKLSAPLVGSGGQKPEALAAVAGAGREETASRVGSMGVSGSRSARGLANPLHHAASAGNVRTAVLTCSPLCVLNANWMGTTDA